MRNPFKRIEALEWKVEALLLKLDNINSGGRLSADYEAHLAKAPMSVLKEIEERKKKI